MGSPHWVAVRMNSSLQEAPRRESWSDRPSWRKEGMARTHFTVRNSTWAAASCILSHRLGPGKSHTPGLFGPLDTPYSDIPLIAFFRVLAWTNISLKLRIGPLLSALLMQSFFAKSSPLASVVVDGIPVLDLWSLGFIAGETAPFVALVGKGEIIMADAISCEPNTTMVIMQTCSCVKALNFPISTHKTQNPFYSF